MSTATEAPVTVFTGVVPAALCDAALRMLLEDVRARGLAPSEMDAWDRVSCPFPHRRFDQCVLAIRERIAAAIGGQGEPCEPQFVWQFPTPLDYGDPPPHVDTPPPWANGRPYTAIVGVALNDWTAQNGALRVWWPDGPGLVLLRTGDVVVLGPETLHASGINRTGTIRAGVYFRWVERA